MPARPLPTQPVCSCLLLSLLCIALTLRRSPVVTDERYHFDDADLDRVQRRLKQRHVQMCVNFLSCATRAELK